MKYRIVEDNYNKLFYIQCKSKFGFWNNAYGQCNKVISKLGIKNYPNEIFSHYYLDYNKAKDCFDLIIKSELEYIKRRKKGKIIRDEIDLNKSSDKFIESL